MAGAWTHIPAITVIIPGLMRQGLAIASTALGWDTAVSWRAISCGGYWWLDGLAPARAAHTIVSCACLQVGYKYLLIIFVATCAEFVVPYMSSIKMILLRKFSASDSESMEAWMIMQCMPCMHIRVWHRIHASVKLSIESRHQSPVRPAKAERFLKRSVFESLGSNLQTAVLLVQVRAATLWNLHGQQIVRTRAGSCITSDQYRL